MYSITLLVREYPTRKK